MPIQGYTPNRSLAKISQNSTDGWDAWLNQNFDTLDEPVLAYNVAAAESLSAGDVAVIKDDGTGAKKAYLATSVAYVSGDPLGVALASVVVGASVKVALEGRVQNGGWSFGPSDKFVYLSSSGTVTTTATSVKLGYVLSSSAICFKPQMTVGGQTDTVTGSNGVQNTGNNVNANLSPVYGSSANTVCQGNDTRLHSQNTDQGTSAASFEINYTANSARLLTTGLTANRDYTLPDGATKLVGESVPATITAQHSFSPSVAQAPFTLGANAQGQVVTGLNADTVDGSHASAFATSGHNHDATYAPIAKGVTNGDSHDHAGGDGAAISLTTAVTGTLPIANGGTGQTTANAALNALLPSQTGKSGNILLSDATNTSWTPFGRKNFADNGNFNIWQRGTAAVTANNGYFADRWLHQYSGDSNSSTQGVFVSGDALFDPTSGNTPAAYYAQAIVTSVASAGNYAIVAQRIENVRLLANKTVTVSFWAKAASGAPLIGVSIDQSFGTGGSGDAQGAGQSVTLSTSWAKYTKTFTLPSLNGKTIGTPDTDYTQIIFWLDAGSSHNTRSGTIGQSSKTVSIAQVQVEIGSVATDFEVVSVQRELALLQRYLPAWTSDGTMAMLGLASNFSTSGAYGLLTHPVPARVKPTGLVISNGAHLTVHPLNTGYATTSVSFHSSSPTATTLNMTVSGTPLTAGQIALFYFNNASACIYLTGCEL